MQFVPQAVAAPPFRPRRSPLLQSSSSAPNSLFSPPYPLRPPNACSLPYHDPGHHRHVESESGGSRSPPPLPTPPLRATKLLLATSSVTFKPTRLSCLGRAKSPATSRSSSSPTAPKASPSAPLRPSSSTHPQTSPIFKISPLRQTPRNRPPRQLRRHPPLPLRPLQFQHPPQHPLPHPRPKLLRQREGFSSRRSLANLRSKVALALRGWPGRARTAASSPPTCETPSPQGRAWGRLRSPPLLPLQGARTKTSPSPKCARCGSSLLFDVGRLLRSGCLSPNRLCPIII